MADLPNIDGRLWTHPDARVVTFAVAGSVTVAFAVWLVMRLRRTSPEELERRRRTLLAEHGRITDGVLDDARTLLNEEAQVDAADVLVYSYELAGVSYQCAQDVSALKELAQGVCLDQPVQVRYEPRSPGNSVIVTETWSGLRWRR